MNWLTDLLSNKFLIVGCCSWAVAQVLKTVIYAAINHRIDLERLIGDGGMPSGHSATVTSVAAMSALSCGFGSFEFAISAILAIIVCHDAMGVRWEAGKQAAVLNELLEILEAISKKNVPEAKLKEFVGHTPLQVAAGTVIGIFNAIFMYFVIYV